MARLILDEGGTKRRFKLNPGKLTVGSGEAATLTLRSKDVAELHAELLFEGGVARLRPRPGVLPPTVAGKPIAGEVVLAAGQTVRIGAASFSVEYDDGEGPKHAAPAAGAAGGAARPAQARSGAGAANVPQAARPGAPAKAAPKAAAGAAKPTSAARARGGVQRQSRAAKKSVPTWLILLLFALGLGLAYYFGKGAWETTTAADFNPAASDMRYRDLLAANDIVGANKVLGEFEGQTLTPEWRSRYEAMKKEMADVGATTSRLEIERGATRYWQSQLENYQKNYLSPEATRPKARVFMKRIAWFIETYPDHPQRPWLDRMQERYRDIAAMNEPATLADVTWEINTLTAAKPRDYPRAYELLDEFLARASGEDADAARELKASLLESQKAFFDEQLLDAAVKYDIAKYPNKYDPSAVFEILLQLVVGMAEPELRDDAANRLVAMPEAKDLLPGYKSDRPEDFARVTEHPTVRAFAERHGLID